MITFDSHYRSRDHGEPNDWHDLTKSLIVSAPIEQLIAFASLSLWSSDFLWKVNVKFLSDISVINFQVFITCVLVFSTRRTVRNGKQHSGSKCQKVDGNNTLETQGHARSVEDSSDSEPELKTIKQEQAEEQMKTH